MSGDTQVHARVRPQRGALLISYKTSKKDFLNAIRFLTMIWGGKYFPILVTGTKIRDSKAIAALEQVRPEVVCLYDVDINKWTSTCNEHCQPRGIIDAKQELANQFEYNTSRLITSHRIFYAESRMDSELKRKNVKILKFSPNSPMSHLMAVSFGFLDDDSLTNIVGGLHTDVKTIPYQFDSPSYIKLCKDLAKSWTLIDFANNNLQLQHWEFGTFVFPPTIIVAKASAWVDDFSLYWNLRMRNRVGFSGKIILISEKDTTNIEVLDELVKWLQSYENISNYCCVESLKCNIKVLASFSRKLKYRLVKNNSKIKYVDVNDQRHRLPMVLPYEHDEYIKLFEENNVITFDKISLCYDEYLQSINFSWICDLVENSKTKRSPFELCIPENKTTLEVVRASSPPCLNGSIPKVGYGLDSTNILISHNSHSIQFTKPTDKELLESILIENNVKIKKDEKRTRYLQAISIAGGFIDAAKILSGNSLKVILSFIKIKNNIQETTPLTLGEIKGTARLASSPAPPFYSNWLNHLSGHEKRITTARFDEYYKDHQQDINSILNKLEDKGIVKRKWKLAKCNYCDKAYWIDCINISDSQICPGCSKHVFLGSKIDLGYELNELMALSIIEGIVPIVLTARFLYNLTNKGFFWIPGIKCTYNSIDTDLDIFASCDGHLVAVEGKTLKGIPSGKKVWDEIYEQLKEPIKIANHCNVSIFILASLCDSYPKKFIKKCQTLVPPNMSIQFLAKDDLETGRRKCNYGGAVGNISITDFLPQRVTKKRKRRKKNRSIKIF